MTSDWLDKRIAEVVAANGAFTGVTPTFDDVPISKPGKIIVAFKLRMDSDQWERFKAEMQAWLPRGIEGKFMARFEENHPQWYQKYTPSIDGNLYQANNFFEAQSQFDKMAQLQRQQIIPHYFGR